MDAKTATVDEHASSHPHDPPQGDRLEVPEVTWYKDPGLRKLYLMIPILFLGATINGYDGSLLNGLQTLKPWQECTFSRLVCLLALIREDFDHPHGSRIGLFTAMQNIGAIAAMPFCKLQELKSHSNANLGMQPLSLPTDLGAEWASPSD